MNNTDTTARSPPKTTEISDAEFENSHDMLDADFQVEIAGYEGPLDLLLELARRQKVDLGSISILSLVEQYIAFIQNARKLKLKIAGDYLIMAAWLAYLKSRLLLPKQKKSDEPDAANLAANLALKLQYLQKMRRVAQQLFERPQLDRDFFQCGGPERLGFAKTYEYEANLHDLLSAYAQTRQKQSHSRVQLKTRTVWSLQKARTALERISGEISNWTDLDEYLLLWTTSPEKARTIRASTFVASLEMTREGVIELEQKEAFSPIKIRTKPQSESESSEPAP